MKINPAAAVTAIIAAIGASGLIVFNTMNVAKAPTAIVAPIAKLAEPIAPAKEAAPAKEPEKSVVASATSNTVEVPVADKPIAPSFDTVRVEPSGDAVIAGRAAPNTEVVAKLDGTVVATATTTADGSFVMIPAKPLPAGAGTLSLETNIKGAVQVSEATVAVAVKAKEQAPATVAVIAPDQPTKVLQAPAPASSVALDAVD